ncbi:MAG: IS1182 family transposase [Myxococcota bacterium]
MTKTASPKPRILEPQRAQGEIRFEMPDDILAADHPARLIWEVLGRVDLSPFAAACGSVEGRAGRPPLSPRMVLTLWLYGISQGVGSAREVARLTSTDIAYRWIVGDLSITHHKLSAFRATQTEALNALFTDVLASLMEKGLLSLELVAQDGTRTRAAASAPSFRTYGSLKECREQAALHLKAVLAAADDPQYTRAQHARREVAAREFQARVEAAMATVQTLQKERLPTDKPARASTTDADARVMKMPDGGYRPAYNVQYAVAGSPMGGPRTIVGVEVTNVGSDRSSITPMAEQIEERTGQRPQTVLADGGHANHEDIAEARRRGIDVIVPPMKGAKALDEMKNADPEVLAWRRRMETDEAKELYRARSGLVELANANQKTHHGITQFLVRGIPKVTSVVLMSAIASNILQHAHSVLG